MKTGSPIVLVLLVFLLCVGSYPVPGLSFDVEPYYNEDVNEKKIDEDLNRIKKGSPPSKKKTDRAPADKKTPAGAPVPVQNTPLKEDAPVLPIRQESTILKPGDFLSDTPIGNQNDTNKSDNAPVLVSRYQVDSNQAFSLSAGVSPQQKRNFLPGLNAWITMNFPLNTPATNEQLFADSDILRYPSTVAHFEYRRSDWFMRFSLLSYFNSQQQGIWDPDFTYKLGYETYQANRFSFYYFGDGRNRLNPDPAVDLDNQLIHLEEGTLTLQYNVPISSNFQQAVAMGESSEMGAQLRYRTIPRIVDETGKSVMNWQQWAGIYAWYNLTHRLYVATTFNYYFGTKQNDWDPDFSYELGFLDWLPGRLSLEYFNYSGRNRYPWRQKEGASFLDGSLALSFLWKF